jgi:hypothetical protein
MRLLLALTMSATLVFGCGDGSYVTTLTVENVNDLRGFDPAPITFEYVLACEERPSNGEPQLVGEFEPVGPGSVNGEPGSLWSASVDAPPGPCSVQLRMRYSDGQLLCTNDEEFVVMADAPTEVDLLMICEFF